LAAGLKISEDSKHVHYHIANQRKFLKKIKENLLKSFKIKEKLSENLSYDK